jgi:hypothetical protein
MRFGTLRSPGLISTPDRGLLLVVSMKEDGLSTGFVVAVMARGRVGGGERRSCLYRRIGVGIRRNGRLVAAAHFRGEPSCG